MVKVEILTYIFLGFKYSKVNIDEYDYAKHKMLTFVFLKGTT